MITLTAARSEIALHCPLCGDAVAGSNPLCAGCSMLLEAAADVSTVTGQERDRRFQVCGFLEGALAAKHMIRPNADRPGFVKRTAVLELLNCFNSAEYERIYEAVTDEGATP